MWYAFVDMSSIEVLVRRDGEVCCYIGTSAIYINVKVHADAKPCIPGNCERDRVIHYSTRIVLRITRIGEASLY